MSLLSPVYAVFPGLAYRRLARKLLESVASSDTSDRIIAAARVRHETYRNARPQHSIGVNLLMRHLEWDLALFEAAITEGLSETDAGTVVSTVKWKVFGPLSTLAFRISRIRGRSVEKRVGWLLDTIFKVLFTRPFQRTVLRDDGLAFDVTGCPMARYCQDHGVPQLTRHAACDVDYRMAQAWRVRLDRTQTLATGGSCCDFRFRVDTPSMPNEC